LKQGARLYVWSHLEITPFIDCELTRIIRGDIASVSSYGWGVAGGGEVVENSKSNEGFKVPQPRLVTGAESIAYKACLELRPTSRAVRK